MNTLTITIFTDPIMGLSYESEPFLRKLETHFPNQITIKNVMSGLVRNVYDFVDKNDLAVSQEYAIARYLPRLAAIYNAEQDISGMPVCMENLQLFSTERTSSIPLNLAYKAVERIEPNKADEFLYRLRFATIVEVRPTTDTDELVQVAEQVGIEKTLFLNEFLSDRNQQDLQNDFAYRAKMGVRGLPAYLFEYQGKQVLANGVLNDDDFFGIIGQITQGELQPAIPILNTQNVWALIQNRRLISPIEIQYAFDLADISKLEPLLQNLQSNQKIRRQIIAGGEFIFVA